MPVKGARPCRASNPQRGSIEPAPSPAFRPPLRRRPGRSAPRLFFDLRGGGAPASLSSLCAPSLPPSSSSPVASPLVPLAPARSLASLASLPADPPPGVAPLPSESGAGVPPRLTLSLSSRPSPPTRRHLSPPPRRYASRRRRRRHAHPRRHRHRPRHRRSPQPRRRLAPRRLLTYLLVLYCSCTFIETAIHQPGIAIQVAEPVLATNTSLGPPPNPHSPLSPCVVSCLARRCALLPPPPNALSHREHTLTLAGTSQPRPPAPPQVACRTPPAAHHRTHHGLPQARRAAQSYRRTHAAHHREGRAASSRRDANPNPKVPRSRSPGPWRGPGAAAARRSPM